MPNFGQGRAELQDAFVDARLADGLEIRVGTFKAPVGLELLRLRAPTDLALVELALPTALVPNRDVGVAAHGDVLGGRLGYPLAVLNGAPDGGSADADTDDGPEGAARLFAPPARSATAAGARWKSPPASTASRPTPPPFPRSPIPARPHGARRHGPPASTGSPTPRSS